MNCQKYQTPAVGSSKMMMRDPPTNAIATHSFLFIPPNGLIMIINEIVPNSKRKHVFEKNYVLNTREIYHQPSLSKTQNVISSFRS